MTLLLWIILIIAVFSQLLYHRISLLVHTIAAAIIITAIIFLHDISTVFSYLTGIVFILLALILNVPVIRRKIITDKVLKVYQKMMPKISQTEEEAIEAGTVWWDGELFSGRPDWNKLLDLPGPGLSQREEEFLKGPVEELCRMLDDWQITRELQDLPEDAWDFIKKNGFFGMIIPEKYGGLEFSSQAHSAVVMKIASRSMSAAVTVMVPNSLGPAELLKKYGTDEQRNYYLPRLATGQEIPCFGLTGPDAGSDAASIPDTGIVCKGEYEGQKDVLGIRLNWEKRYITLGPVATVLGLAFRLYDPEHLLGKKEDIGITLALVPTDTPGVEIGNRHFPLDSAFQVGPNWGKDVFIPVDSIIGGSERAGEGWRMLMDCLAEGRSISLPALSAGSSKLASRFVGAYARIRKQFNMPIGNFEGVEEALANIAGYTYMMDSARTMTAIGVDLGEEPAVISAIVKYHLTELTRKVINHAMDIRGGAGICMGPQNLLGRIYQSIPISITVEGANILTRNMIIFGQGIIRGHPYLLREIKAAGDDNSERSRKEFDRAFMSHTGFILSNIARSSILAKTGSHFVTVPGSSYVQPYLRHLTRMSSAFVLAADVSMLVLGSALKKRERISARLADILSYMYLASAVIKRFEDDGAGREDLPLLYWTCEILLYNIQESFYDIFRNFPSRAVAWLLKGTIFPFGKSFSRPTDHEDHSAAEILLSQNRTRDRLTDGIFIPKNPEEPLGRAEDALAKVIAVEPMEKKIQKALKDGNISGAEKDEQVVEAVRTGVISEKEADIVREAINARRGVVRVDDFPEGKWKRE